jgi:hypothetical protein
VNALRDRLGDRFPIHSYQKHVNDPEFGKQVADLFVQLLNQEQK